MIGSLLSRVLWWALVMAPARQVLVGLRDADGANTRFQRRDVDRLLARAWNRYQSMSIDLPKEPSLSGRVSVLAAAMLLALMHALVGAGVERSRATRLVADVSWAAYQRSLGKGAPALLRRLVPDPLRRIRVAVDIGLTYEFTEPSYHHRRVRVPGGDGFDMLRCPIADYLKAQDASDLCTMAFCALDYRVFELVDLRLKRSGTIGGGAELCDFRAFPTPPVQ
jgi:L-2-amino-thiazoline-4-carboxylic acid hydrolase